MSKKFKKVVKWNYGIRIFLWLGLFFIFFGAIAGAWTHFKYSEVFMPLIAGFYMLLSDIAINYIHNRKVYWEEIEE